MKIKNFIIDNYLKIAILADIAICIVSWLISKYYPIFAISLENKSTQLSILANLISTNISLAGFILAALTIIVTFKSNLESKGIAIQSNALELIFSTKHYDNIVSVFKKAIIEFTICFIFLYFSWALSDSIKLIDVYRINICGIIITSLTISRSLFILSIILDLGKFKKSNK